MFTRRTKADRHMTAEAPYKVKERQLRQIKAYTNPANYQKLADCLSKVFETEIAGRYSLVF